MISRRLNSSKTPRSITWSAPDFPRTAGLMPLSAAELCIHISQAGKETPRSRCPYDVSKEAVRQALYILLERPRRGDRRGDDKPGSRSLEELVEVYTREYSDWENLKAREIVAELNLHFAREASAPRLLTDTDTRASGPKRRALLVDDLPDILVTVGAFLASAGFEVDHVASGDRALDGLASDAGLDLLVTDHAMPGLSGKELVVLAQEKRPDLKVVIITGYPNATELANLPPRVELLAKPFRRLQLTECIERLFREERFNPVAASSERVV